MKEAEGYTSDDDEDDPVQYSALSWTDPMYKESVTVRVRSCTPDDSDAWETFKETVESVGIHNDTQTKLCMIRYEGRGFLLVKYADAEQGGVLQSFF